MIEIGGEAPSGRAEADGGADRPDREAQSLLQGAARRERQAGGAAEPGHVLRGDAEGGRPGVSAGGGGHLRELRLQLPAHWQDPGYAK